MRIAIKSAILADYGGTCIMSIRYKSSKQTKKAYLHTVAHWLRMFIFTQIGTRPRLKMKHIKNMLHKILVSGKPQ